MAGKKVPFDIFNENGKRMRIEIEAENAGYMTDMVYANCRYLISTTSPNKRVNQTVTLHLTDPIKNVTYEIPVSPEQYVAAIQDQRVAMELFEKETKKKFNPIFETDQFNQDLIDQVIEEDLLSNVYDNKNQDKGESSEEAIDDEGDEIEVPIKKRRGVQKNTAWPDAAVKLLLVKFEENEKLYATNSSKLWGIIQQALKEENISKTRSEIRQKLEKMKTDYKKVQDANRQTGARPQTCPFFKELDDIFHAKSWANPIKSNRIAGSAFEMPETSGMSSKSRCSKDNFFNSFLNIQERKLEQRSKFHEEKMAELSSLKGMIKTQFFNQKD